MKRWLIGLIAAGAWGASAEDIIKEADAAVAADSEATPRSRAETLKALSEGQTLAADQQALLTVAIAEAWIEAGDPAAAEASAVAAMGGAPSVRERAGLALVAAWQERLRKAEAPAELPILDLTQYGDLGPRVPARAACVEAQRQLAVRVGGGAPAGDDGTAILDRIDGALAMLAAAGIEDRVPVYNLRMLAMERLGRTPAAIQAWMSQHANDPAAALLAELALTGSQRLIGRPAPPLKARRRDGQAGELDLATVAGGKPCIVLFVATWSPTSEALLPLVQPAADAAGAAVLAVSLDNKDTIDRIPAWVQRLNLTCPVIGEGIGWDGELDDAWQIDQVPAAILVGADGKIVAVDLGQGKPESFPVRLAAAMAARPGGGPATGALPAPVRRTPTPDDAIIP